MNSAAAERPLEIVVFEAAGQSFGVRSSLVREIVRAATLSAAPRSHPAILGILNLRGQVVAVYDLRWMLEAPATPLAPSDCLIVTQSAGHWLALRADRAVELVQLAPGGIEASSAVVSNWNAVEGVAKIQGRLVLLIDPNQLWSRADPGEGLP